MQGVEQLCAFMHSLDGCSVFMVLNAACKDSSEVSVQYSGLLCITMLYSTELVRSIRQKGTFGQEACSGPRRSY